MPQPITGSYRIDLGTLNGSTTTGYFGITNTGLAALNKISLSIPSGLTVTISVTEDVPADSTSTWYQVDSGITSQLYTYGAAAFTGIRVVRTAGSGAVNGMATEIGVASSISSIVPGTGASNLGKAEDAAHASGDVGVEMLVVRNDAGGNMVSADGDYAPMQVDSSGNLRVNIAAGSTSGQQYADGAARGTATGTLAMGDDGTNIQSVHVDTSGDLQIDVLTSALPTGAATAANQSTANTSLASIDGKITACNTGAVVVSSSALPSGASTAAKQDTGNTSLASIDGKITACNTGAVVIASGSVTANAGTDLNTSLLALESGGNLAAIAASASVLDDWDESDRAKVNIVVGQAGVTAGAGAVAANTPRMTLASDDPAVASLSVLDDWDESDRCKVNPISGQAGVAGNTGTVGATTQRVTLATDVALPAGTNLLGKISGSIETSTIYDGTTALTPKFAFANVAASQTDSSIVAAVTSKKIRVHQAFAVAGGTATNLTFNSKPGGAGSAISPLLANGANGGEILPFSPMGWFQTTAGEGLTVTTGAGATTGIMVGYTEV